MKSVSVKAIRVSLLSFAAMSAWCSPAFSQRQTAVGPGTIPLDANGVLNGVDMSGSATTGTLSVGVPGGPATDIFTLNNPPVAGRIAVSTAASSQGNIIFNSSSTVYGAIGQTQPAGPFLLALSGGNAGTTVNFMGPVFATTTEVSGTGALNFNSGSTNITAINFAGDGRISLAPNTTVIGALTTTAGANTGTLQLGGASVLDGAVGGAIGLRAINVVGGSNLAGVTSTITGAANAFSFALGTNTLNVGGALTIANGGPSGVIHTTLASPSLYGNIRPVGATNLGPALLINVTVPATSYIPVGTQFNIVQTRSGTVQSGTDGTVLAVTIQDPTNPLYTFRAVPAAGTIAGLVTIETTGIPLTVPIAPPAGVILPPSQPIAAAVVPILLAVTPTPDIISVLAPINALSDPAAVVNAVTQLAPSPSDLAAPLVTFHGNRQFQNLWMARLDCGALGRRDERGDPQRNAETDDCSHSDQRIGWWMNGFGYFAQQDNQQAFAGYKAKTGGGMAGYDAPIGPDTHMGFGLGYARTDVRARGSEGRTDLDSYQVTAYLGHEPGIWFVNAALSYAYNEYSGSRRIVFTGVDREARADFTGRSYSGFASTGLHLYAGDISITPLASIEAMRVDIGGYTETGAGDISLRVQARKYDFVESGLGVKVARYFSHAGGSFVPELRARWLHELSNPKLAQTASFVVPGSPSFTTPGFRNADDTYNVGAGITLLSAAGARRAWSLQAGYDYFGTGKGYSAHQGTIKLTGRF